MVSFRLSNTLYPMVSASSRKTGIRSVGPDLGQNCLPRFSADDKG